MAVTGRQLYFVYCTTVERPMCFCSVSFVETIQLNAIVDETVMLFVTEECRGACSRQTY